MQRGLLWFGVRHLILPQIKGTILGVMANTTSAKKASRAALRKRVFNENRKRAMRSGIKDFKRLVASKGKSAEKLPEVFQAIDKAAKRGVIRRGAADRIKSKLSKLLATK